MSCISPLAIVHPSARIGTDVHIGPFCVIGEHVEIGDGCVLHNSVTVVGHTKVGRKNVIYPTAVLGTPPQDKKYGGEATRLEIGDENEIREAVTIHIGTAKGSGVTRIGSHNLLMVNVHIGHDSHFGNKCILSNNVMIAGHVHCGDGVAMMGGVGIHHFVTVGEYSYLGGYSRIHHDVPPYVKINGDDDRIRAVNTTGLVRHNFTPETVRNIQKAAKFLFYGRDEEHPTLAHAIRAYRAGNDVDPHVERMIVTMERRTQSNKGRYLETFRPAAEWKT